MSAADSNEGPSAAVIPLRKFQDRSIETRDPPDLQELVLKYGTYDRIPDQAWKEFEARTALWRAFMTGGGLHRR